MLHHLTRNAENCRIRMRVGSIVCAQRSLSSMCDSQKGSGGGGRVPAERSLVWEGESRKNRGSRQRKPRTARECRATQRSPRQRRPAQATTGHHRALVGSPGLLPLDLSTPVTRSLRHRTVYSGVSPSSFLPFCRGKIRNKLPALLAQTATLEFVPTTKTLPLTSCSLKNQTRGDMDIPVPKPGGWPVDPQDDQEIQNDRIWVDGCFDFAHHGRCLEP